MFIYSLLINVYMFQVSYDFYNGEKDMWLFGANDVISHPLNIEKQSVLMTENHSPLP